MFLNKGVFLLTVLAQCAFLIPEVEICQNPDFVIYMSNNPSSKCCRLLRRLVVLYEGEIRLYFDPPSRHSHRTRSPLLWAVFRILYLDRARFIELLYVHSPFYKGWSLLYPLWSDLRPGSRGSHWVTEVFHKRSPGHGAKIAIPRSQSHLIIINNYVHVSTRGPRLLGIGAAQA